MSTDLGPEFLEKYNSIENNLKKRFMRKPNVSEATEEFNNLAVQCELVEQPPFAGICYLEAATCESSIGNTVGEVEYLLLSARQFMKAELKLSSLRCVSPGREHLEAAINSYVQAYSKYSEDSSLRASVLMELAGNLETLGHFTEAINYYKICLKDYKSSRRSSANQLNVLSKISSILLKKENYPEALKYFKTMYMLAIELDFNKYIQSCELNIFLLYLIVQPSPEKITIETEIVNKYSIDNDEESPLHPELVSHLQSVLFACKVNDIKMLMNLNTEMKNFLSIEQTDLMQTLIATYESLM